MTSSAWVTNARNVSLPRIRSGCLTAISVPADIDHLLTLVTDDFETDLPFGDSSVAQQQTFEQSLGRIVAGLSIRDTEGLHALLSET
ncbi:hypothetical protein [Streptomyces spiralis]|uniref:hypothetical protein n=1 Tax=Streptomyces spiralis TaxID=66376 RepID=UPI0033F3ED55